MGSLGGECHPSAGWMRCPKDLYHACLLSSSLLNCEVDFSWNAVWGYEFNFETKNQNKHHIHQHIVSLKAHSGSIHMHLKLRSCNAFSISPGLLSLFQLPVEEAEKNGWCVHSGHCQRQARSRINSVLPNDHHCQGRGPSVCRITVTKFGYARKHAAKAGGFLLACVARWHGFLCWVTLTCPQGGLSRNSQHAWCLACYWFWFFFENLAKCFLHVMGKKI